MATEIERIPPLTSLEEGSGRNFDSVGSSHGIGSQDRRAEEGEAAGRPDVPEREGKGAGRGDAAAAKIAAEAGETAADVRREDEGEGGVN